MVKMTDVQIGQSGVVRPKWYHWGTISLILHGILLTLGYYWIPESPAIVFQPQSTSIVHAMPAIESFDENDTELSPEAVSADANPFETPDEPDVPQPRMNLNVPKDAFIQESKSIPTAGLSIPTEFTSEPSILEQSDERTDDRIVVPQNANDGQDTPLLENVNAGNESIAGTHQNMDSSDSAGMVNRGNAGNSKPVIVVDESALWDGYKKKLNAHFKSHRHYPEMAQRLKLAGTVVVSVEIQQNGEVLSVQLEQSSGIEILDEAAISSAKAASPAPAFPKGVTAQVQKVLIPYRYSIH